MVTVGFSFSIEFDATVALPYAALSVSPTDFSEQARFPQLEWLCDYQHLTPEQRKAVREIVSLYKKGNKR